MITAEDLKQAIAECMDARPTANTCLKMAAYMTILDHMEQGTSSDSEFMRRARKHSPEYLIGVFDELMTKLSSACPRLYDETLKNV